MSTKVLALATLLASLAACGSDGATPSAPPSTQAASQSAAVISSGAPPATAFASTSGTGKAPATPPASDAGVAKLLEGGAALSALPVRSVDSGKSFDPGLRDKLAPERPTNPSKL